jgi:hypothetical protein
MQQRPGGLGSDQKGIRLSDRLNSQAVVFHLVRLHHGTLLRIVSVISIEAKASTATGRLLVFSMSS